MENEFFVIEIPPTEEDRQRDNYDFFQQFTEAEKKGHGAVVVKFDALFEECKKDYKKMTELYVITNHKIWHTYKTDRLLSVLYDRMWRCVEKWVVNNFSKQEMEYFYQTTD